MEKIKPVLAALVKLRPKVKPLWVMTTPRHPRAAIGNRSSRRSLLRGPRTRMTPYISIPPMQNRKATSSSGGMDRAANLVAAKFSPQKTAARIREISVSNTALSLVPATAPDSTPGPPRPQAPQSSRLPVVAHRCGLPVP